MKQFRSCVFIVRIFTFQDSSISVHPPAKPPVVNWALQDTWTGDNEIKSCVDENKKKEVEENEQKGLAEKSKQKEWKKEEKVCCGDDKTIPEGNDNEFYMLFLNAASKTRLKPLFFRPLFSNNFQKFISLICNLCTNVRSVRVQSSNV